VALTDPSRSHLTAGLAAADSWTTDGHKWLNVPYDCGITLVRRPGDLRCSFATVAGYLPPDTGFEAMNHTPQSSPLLSSKPPETDRARPVDYRHLRKISSQPGWVRLSRITELGGA